MSHIILGASVNSTPPSIYSHVLAVIAARRPFVLDIVPASIAPNGAPIANTERTVAYSVVVCPGNTTLSGAFLCRDQGIEIGR